MSPPTFSIVVPCHNYARFLSTTIDSVLAQGRDDLEIVVVDDASTDDSADVAEAYGEPVRVIRLERNRGPGGAWDVGLQAATGEFLCKLDADDWQLPGFLARVEDEFRRDERIGLVATGAYLYTEGTARAVVERPAPVPTLLDEAALRRALLRKFFVRMPATALRRSALVGHDPPRDDLRLPHDWEYFLRVLSGWRASLLPDPLAVYRVHGASLTLTTSADARLQADMRRLVDVTADPADPAFLPDPRERRILAVGAAKGYLGSVGPRLRSHDLRGLARHLAFAASLARRRSGWGALEVLGYALWGAWQRLVVRRRRPSVAVDRLLPGPSRS